MSVVMVEGARALRRAPVEFEVPEDIARVEVA